MKDNSAYPGLIHLMRKGDFESWSGELQTAERLSEFEVRRPAREDGLRDEAVRFLGGESLSLADRR